MPRNENVKEFISSIGPTSGITISNAKPPSDLDSEQKKLDEILTEDNQSKAKGRRGQNDRLATKLIN